MLIVQLKKQLSHFVLEVDFKISSEIAVLYGPSGSGKTTILQSIAGLTKINDGNIILNNRFLNKKGKLLISVQKRNIGYVFQDYALFPHKTVWENIAYGMKEELFTRNLIKELQLGHLLDQYPHEISGGEKQRTALIRAIATKPELLLLDEPFSALDTKTKEISYDQLKKIHRLWQIPIILVTHNPYEMEYLGQKLLFLEKGQIKRKVHNESLYNTFS